MSGRQQVIGNANSFNTLNNYNNIVNIDAGLDAERDQILRWLSPLEPQQRHEGVRTDRLDSVGDWVLENNEFRKWCDTEDGCVEPVLFCCGNPGVGKTYLSSLVIDSLCDQAAGKDIAVVGLYCDFLAQKEQSATSMLGAILKQLVTRGETPEHIREAFQKAKREFGGRGLRLSEMIEILKKAITSLHRIFVCIDALDELAPRYRLELLESLQEMVRISSNMRVLLTGRPHIDDEVMEYFSKAIRIPVTPTQDDIKSYLEMRLKRDATPKAMDAQLRADVMRVIPERISEIFLLVSLNIEAILGEITLHQRRKKLDEMTKGEGLGGAYAATISRIKAQQRSRSKLGMEVLMWVSHSERPLQVDELCHALGVEEGSTDLNVRNIPAIETLLACCLGLVTVEKSSSTIRLVHYTLQEYLSHNQNLFSKPHSVIAEVCLTYLNFGEVRSFSPTLHSALPTPRFVEYASCYWGIHAKRGTTESAKRRALELLDGYDKHISSRMLLLHKVSYWDRPFGREGSPRGFTGLHGAAYFGCVEIMVALLEEDKWDVQASDLKGNTALAWAARRGNEGVVKLLLERNDTNPNTADEDSQTPLSLAAKNGHERVVDILLKRNDVNPNIADKYGQTPLSLAAINGNEGVVEMLLERNDVNPDTPNKSGRTPLSLAVINGHERTVKILLERNDINSDTPDIYSLTPLSLAAFNGREGVAKILVERSDVDPNTPDIYGRTPLSLAAKKGHEQLVRILMKRNDVSPNTTDKYGQTPLSFAAEYGREGVVGVLLERSDVDSNTTDKYGQTPLSLAAEYGREGVVRILLERNDVNPNTPDIYGRTPLSLTAKKGHEEVVRMLMERNDINSNTADKYGQTPLSLAAEYGREGVVGILLERSDVNPNTPDIYGGTPLSLAAKKGHEEVVRILMKRNDVDSNAADKYGQTPLSVAAENGCEGIVGVLLERNDVNPDIADEFGRTPLSWAAEDGDEEVVRLLLEQSDVNADTIDERGRTPLSWAAEGGNEGAVRLLLERSEVNPGTADEFGLTPLSRAAQNGHEGVAKLLRGPPDLVPRGTSSAQPTGHLSLEPPELSKPHSKRTRRF